MNDTVDIIAIAQLMQHWAFCRDQGRWADLADTFTEDGEISVSWFSGSFKEFVTRGRAMHKPVSPRSKHWIGVPVVQVMGDRAIAQTSIQILGRVNLGGVSADNTSYGRFVDRIRRTEKGWRIARRVAVYEKDRLDPVIPSAEFDRFMADTDFSDIPEAYRFLGYRLRENGQTLRPDIIIDGTAEAHTLLEETQSWLASGDD